VAHVIDLELGVDVALVHRLGQPLHEFGGVAEGPVSERHRSRVERRHRHVDPARGDDLQPLLPRDSEADAGRGLDHDIAARADLLGDAGVDGGVGRRLAFLVTRVDVRDRGSRVGGLGDGDGDLLGRERDLGVLLAGGQRPGRRDRDHHRVSHHLNRL
jgi:hypothetical protein